MAEWFSNLGSGTLDILKWFLVLMLLVGGFLGTFIPIIPGAVFIVLAAVAHYFLFGMEESRFSVWSFIPMGLLLILSVVVDYVSGALGAKYYGATKWGAIGAIVGGIAGIFFPFPGLIVGPLVGAFAGELIFARREWQAATKSTWGTVVGGLTGMAFKLVIAIAMIAWYVADVFFVN